eukprot:COSAG01_NODE_1556_length_9940_cov_13.610337_4_plen_67_part_00
MILAVRTAMCMLPYVQAAAETANLLFQYPSLLTPVWYYGVRLYVQYNVAGVYGTAAVHCRAVLSYE